MCRTARIRAASDDGAVGRPLGAVPEEFRFEFDLQLALGHSPTRETQGCDVTRCRGVSGPPHRVEFGGVLGAAGLRDLLAET